jgi:sec-independent protein translocase protein TatC
MATKTTTITGHLKELRSRLIKSVVFLLLAFIICFIFADNIYAFLLDPYVQATKNDPMQRRMIFTALHETFLTYLKLAFFSAFCLSFPVILIQIWKFIAPGLYKNEKMALLPFLIATPILFVLGGMLVYYLIMPLAVKFFLSFETTSAMSGMPIQLEAKVDEYLSLITKLIFAFGLSFQLPVLLTLLGKVGFLTAEDLKKRRRYVIVLIFTAAAILTPPDPITQIGLALPLLLLYEISIFTVKTVQRK